MNYDELNSTNHVTTKDKRILDMAMNCWCVTFIGDVDNCNTCGSEICRYINQCDEWEQNPHVRNLTDRLEYDSE